jgi:hypothetical protein
MTNSSEGHLRIDDFLPDYDFSAIYDIRINAEPSLVYERLLWLDFNEVWVVRLLEFARTGKLVARPRVSTSLSQRLQGMGFVTLADVPTEEVVMGIAGRFWRPDGGRCMDLTADDFVGFNRPGFAKVAWNFKLRADAQEKTVLSTETRVKCYGQAALWKFGVYWTLIWPFSGVIRKAILNRVKTEAESRL